MKASMLRGLSVMDAWITFGVGSLHAQRIEFRATINSTRESEGSTSTAAGWAVLLYHAGTTTLDLTVRFRVGSGLGMTKRGAIAHDEIYSKPIGSGTR
ncbi:MAG: hypothetical protein ABIV50_12525 [Opitutus sp.]